MKAIPGCDQLHRLRRIESQVRGIARIVEEGQHVNTCLVDAAHHADSLLRVGLKEASDAIARLVRS